MKSKTFSQLISFVAICSTNAHLNNGLSVKSIADDMELNPKNIKVLSELKLSTTASPTENPSTTEDSFKCICGSRDDCLGKCLDDEQKSFETMFLLTASEVVLGTAIIMGLSALVTVLLRICTRPTFVRRGENGVVMPDEFGRMGTRVSLTSLQQRVMSKLRDRPPRYETRHNYEYQRRERTSLPATLNPAAGSNIPPPAYETGDSNSVHELPPTYTIAIEDSGGILNPSFAAEENAANVESDINDRNRTSDSVLHI